MSRLAPVASALSIVSLLMGTLLAPTYAQVGWTSVSLTNKPTARSNHAVVWAGDRAVLFGGESATGYLNDTWEWKNSAWSKISLTANPTVRAGHALAYDQNRKVVVLFSGWNGSSYLADTWEYNFQSWSQVSLTTQPPPRDWATMGYDAIGKRLILFGGHDYRRHANNGPGAWDDTWAYDGKAWTALSPTTPCPKRFAHAMTNRGVALTVLGGSTPGTTYNDMWEFVAGNWKQVTPQTLPGNLLFGTMAYDSSRQRLVLSGGRTDATTMSLNTWEYVSGNWTKRLSTGGPNVTFLASFFDEQAKVTLAHGGALTNDRKKPTDQNLTYGALQPASIVSFGSGCKGAAGTPVLTATDPWLGDPLTLTVKNLGSTAAAFFYAGLSNKTWGTVSLPYDLAAIGASGCKLYVEPTYLIGMGNSNGTATFGGSIPNIPALAGLAVHIQAWATDVSANALGVVVSNAVTGTLGNK